MDGFEPEDLELLHPGVSDAIKRLNKRTGVSDPDELYAGWIVERINGALSVSAMRPSTCRGRQKSFWWDGEEFV